MRATLAGCIAATTLLIASGCVDQPAVGTDSERPDSPAPGGAENYTVVAAGSYAGECWGPCVATMSINRGALHYELQGYEDDVYASNDGLLTELGAGQLGEIEQLLGEQPALQETYGCPDCDDGGASWATLLTASGEPSTHTWEAGNAPEAFLDLSLMVDDLQRALRECEPSVYAVVHASCEAAEPGA